MSVFFIFAFVLIGSAQDAFLGHLLTSEHPIAVVFSTFLIALLILQIAFFLKKPNTLKEIIHNKNKLLMINLVTATNWITFFVALKYIQPAIVGAIAFSIGPAATTALSPALRGSIPRPTIRLWLSSIGVLIAGIFLAYCSISSNSALKTNDTIITIFGILLAATSGIGMTLNTYVSKALSETELTTQAITAFRFIGIVLISGTIMLTNKIHLSDYSIQVYFSVFAIAIIGILLPMTLIQMGIKGTEPQLVAILLSLTPAITLIFETFDARLHFSTMSVVGVMLLCTFAIIGLLK